MNSFNYKEYVLLKDNVHYDKTDMYDFNIPETTFEHLLHKIASIASRKDIKYFQKEYKEYIYSDTIYQIFTDNEIKIYKLIPISTNQFRKQYQWLESNFQKHKLSLINVPSNIDYDTLSYVKTLIFRISNRVYVNFEVKLTDAFTSYKVFINYNHDLNVDYIEIEKQIISIMNLLS